MEYHRVTDAIVNKLQDILGSENVFIQEEERNKYSWDETHNPRPHSPEVVIKPTDTNALAKVMKLANEELIPVTPRGSGSGLCGGAVPIFGGILVSLEKMNNILEIDTRNFVAVAEAGVTLGDLRRTAESQGLYYPLYPGEESASIAGNVATNAGGMMAVKHGVTRNYVLGLEAVLPTGEVIQAGGKYIKSSTGYNLTQLLIGSEGTLAIITEVILRLVTPPGLSILLFVPFNSLSEAIGTVPAILQSKVLPTGIEFMERDVVEIAEKHTGRKIPHEGEAFLMILIEADDEQQAENMAWKVAEICGEHGAIDAFIAKTEQTMRPLLELRERFYPALKAVGTSDILDVVVPRDRIADFMGKVKAIAEKYHIPISGYGHAGDGNVHLHPFGDGKDMTEVYQAIYEAGAAMGGTISGEHGLGFDKKKFLPIVMDTKQIEIMRGIKRVFDPNNILNPGKVI